MSYQTQLTSTNAPLWGMYPQHVSRNSRSQSSRIAPQKKTYTDNTHKNNYKAKSKTNLIKNVFG